MAGAGWVSNVAPIPILGRSRDAEALKFGDAAIFAGLKTYPELEAAEERQKELSDVLLGAEDAALQVGFCTAQGIAAQLVFAAENLAHGAMLTDDEPDLTSDMRVMPIMVNTARFLAGPDATKVVISERLSGC